MIQILFKDDEAILKFPKQLISSGYVQEFLERLRLEAIAEKSLLSDKDAWDLSEELKRNWWKENKSDLLKRIKT